MVLLTSFLIIDNSLASDATEEYMVEIGDKMTYEYEKYLKEGITEELELMEREDGTSFNVSFKVGTRFTFEITSFKGVGEDTRAYAKIIFVAGIQKPIECQYVMKTTDNESYWETKNIGFMQFTDESNFQKMIVDGDQWIIEYMRNYTTAEGIDFYTHDITKYNWKTGWKIYDYRIEEKNGIVTREVELVAIEDGLPSTVDGQTTVNFSIISLIAIITLVIFVVLNRRKVR